MKHRGLWRTHPSLLYTAKFLSWGRAEGEAQQGRGWGSVVKLSLLAQGPGPVPSTNSTNYNKMGPLVGAHLFTSVTFILYLREHSELETRLFCKDRVSLL